MFEQTLLTQPVSAQKTGAFAMSLTAQTCVLGVLVVGPLLYTQKLVVPPRTIVDMFPPPPPPTPQVQRTQTRPEAQSGPSLLPSMRRIFVATAPSAPTIYPTQNTVVLPDAEPGEFATPIPEVAIGGPGQSMMPGIIPTPPAPREPAIVKTPAVEPPAGPVNISKGVLASKLITKVMPQYPPAARAVRAAGVVRLLAIIGIDGHVRELRVLEGHPLLKQAAEDAVWQWVYSPTYLSGRAVEVEAPIEVKFELN